MSEFEFRGTPGPWHIERSQRGYPYRIHAPNGSDGPGGIKGITRWGAISLPTSMEGEANARLIAAAPELFEALKEATLRMQSLGQDTSQQVAALARATGDEG